MKGLLRSTAKKILFGKSNPASFPAVRIPIGELREKFVLRFGATTLDVTSRQCIICHSPFSLAVWLNEGERALLNTSAEALVVIGDATQAVMQLTRSNEFIQGSDYIVIFRVDSAKNFQLGKMRQRLLRSYFKSKNSLHEDQCYAAAYSFPRRVIAVSFKDGDYYNIFPMDFQCFVAQADLHIFGLRTTNITLEKILDKKRIVVGDTDRADVKTLYALGNHHSSSPPTIDKLPFAVTESEKFKFPVSEFSSGYKEIEIVGHTKIGTHMLFYGKVINSKQQREWTSSIYHIHFFHSANSDYIKA